MYVLIFFTSCLDNFMKGGDVSDCTSGNCVNVNIEGLLDVKPPGDKLDDIPVEVFFVRGGLFSFDKKVISGKTDKNGVFNFSVEIDTALFLDHCLQVRISQIENYFSDRWWNDRDGCTKKNVCYYNKEELQNINFIFYKKVTLTINYKRVQTDDLESLFVYLSFENNPANAYIISTAIDVTSQYEVAADVYTKIEWEKRLKGGERRIETDSLICRQNIVNIFNINY